MKQQLIDRFPGISCAWADAVGKEKTECRGFSDKESHAPVNEKTMFPACSISKFITAICIMKLQEQELIDIDTPANRFLQQWKLLTADGAESDAAIRLILCHTAGIVDGEDSFYGLRMSDPEISLLDILEGRTSYNRRPVRTEKPRGTAFEYSDAGYCVLQLLMEDVTQKAFDESVREILFDPLGLSSTFFATPGNIARFENSMATGYDDNGVPVPGRFPRVPDLAASGLWSTPKELLSIADEYLKALRGESSFLRAESAREMAKPAKNLPWTGLGIFNSGENILSSSGWGENGQCMMKMNCRTRGISVVMTNRNPGVDQAESGIEGLVDSKLAVR
ncbi:MAG: serine hydrolase domain-containing protein [Eubacteriales bacterium]